MIKLRDVKSDRISLRLNLVKNMKVIFYLFLKYKFRVR